MRDRIGGQRDLRAVWVGSNFVYFIVTVSDFSGQSRQGQSVVGDGCRMSRQVLLGSGNRVRRRQGKKHIAPLLLAPANHVFPLRLLGLLCALRERRCAGEKDLRSVGRPGEGMGLQLLLVKRKRLSGIRGDQPQPFRTVISALILAVRQRKVGKKRDILAIGRPLRSARVSRAGQRDRSRLSSASISIDRCGSGYAANPERPWR